MVTYLLQFDGQVSLRLCDLSQKIRVPPKERGHKQLGRPNALWHLIQLNILFTIGFWTTLEKTQSVYHARVLLATYGIGYAFEVRKPAMLRHTGLQPPWNLP